jgi:hypothetical protein
MVSRPAVNKGRGSLSKDPSKARSKKNELTPQSKNPAFQEELNITLAFHRK